MKKQEIKKLSKDEMIKNIDKLKNVRITLEGLSKPYYLTLSGLKENSIHIPIPKSEAEYKKEVESLIQLGESVGISTKKLMIKDKEK